MSNYNQSLIEDYRQTIERLQKECTEKTNAIIALGERLKAKTQECEQIKEKYEALKLENQEGYEIVAELKHECEELKEDYAELEQECEKLSILAQEESARNGYVEYELNDKLKQKTQECENLKAEEKYLKQCCTKAGEELAKHSFEYDGKEKNLVVQAIELNEKYEKLKKALEEIEEVLKDEICEECPGEEGCKGGCKEHQCLEIINKAKGR